MLFLLHTGKLCVHPMNDCEYLLRGWQPCMGSSYKSFCHHSLSTCRERLVLGLILTGQAATLWWMALVCEVCAKGTSCMYPPGINPAGTKATLE